MVRAAAVVVVVVVAAVVMDEGEVGAVVGVGFLVKM
jgi:hypothetical protein